MLVLVAMCVLIGVELIRRCFDVKGAGGPDNASP